MTIDKYFVLDVESVGLNGQPFAYGYVVIGKDGKELAHGIHGMDPKKVMGYQRDLDWVLRNCKKIPKDMRTLPELLISIFDNWNLWSCDSYLCADCPHPVETNFLRLAEIQPYPLIDIASVRLAKGLDPIATLPRRKNELPKHNPLADARQSARLLIEAINMV